jgi:hypothetical protein
MYDPSIGRWLEEDPIGFEGGDSNLNRYVGNDPVNATDPSGLLECDDRQNAPGNARLVDVSAILERRVNEVIDEVRREFRPRLARQREEFFRNGLALEAVEEVFNRLGRDVRESGVNTPVGSQGQRSEIEVWLGDNDNLRSANNQINQITFLQSRYRFNRVGWGITSHAPWWFCTQDINILNHGIAPTIKIKDTLMGTDKWGHFFQQGYWLFKLHQSNDLQNPDSLFAFCRFLEGGNTAEDRRQYDLVQFGRLAGRFGSRQGIQGDRASGVISQADINANMGGFSFYSDLFADFLNRRYTFRFRVEDYSIASFNEIAVPNTFTRGVRPNDTLTPAPRLSFAPGSQRF